MKKILWMGGVYAAAVLAQLLTSLLFLFLPWDPLAEAIILSCFLLLMQGCVFLAESGVPTRGYDGAPAGCCLLDSEDCQHRFCRSCW